MDHLMLEFGLDFRGALDLLILIMVSGGVFGFVYEEIFYYFDLGYLVKRGSTFGPWIPIYFFGGAAYTFLAYPLRRNPLAVFLMCVVTSWIMEFVTGYVLYHVFHTRLWDYNKEMMNFGNIGGYVCLRSVLFFGVSGLLLVYMIIPVLAKVVLNVSAKILHPVCLLLAALFVIDVVLFKVLGKERSYP